MTAIENNPSKPSSQGERTFEMSLDVRADAASVWHALSDATELARWFPLEARVDPGKGGRIFLSWGPDCQGEAPITGWEPGRRLAWREQMTMPGGTESVQITVEFILDSHPDGVTLRLIHSGMGAEPEWDGYFDSISNGWKFELRGLRHYLERHMGRDRDVIWVRQRVTGDPATIAARLVGPEGSLLCGTVAGLTAGDTCTLEGTEGSIGAVIEVNALPRSLVLRLPSWEETLLRLELEMSGGKGEVWVWLSTYGWSPARRDSVERALRAKIEQAFS